MENFVLENIINFLPEKFKGLSKEYIIDCIFNCNIQNKWIPDEGDIIVGCTGNIFVISGYYELNQKLGGRLYFFGGGLCSRTESNILDETYCYTMNKSGRLYTWGGDGIIEIKNLNHSKIKDFKFVPYPHEKDRF